MHIQPIIYQLRSRREYLQMTQEQLADLSGIGLRTLKALEAGHSNPTFDTLSKIANVLGMELTLVVKDKNE